jgi:hypothetical protein
MPVVSFKKRQAPFTRFKELPAEARLRIWRYAIPGGRVVQVMRRSKLAYIHPRAFFEDVRLLKVVQSIPAMLHTCYEAREVALEVYRPAFASLLNRAVYFDFRRDLLHFNCEKELNTMLLVDQGNSADLRDLVLSLQHVMVRGRHLRDRTFPNLSRLHGAKIVLLEDPAAYYHPNIEFMRSIIKNDLESAWGASRPEHGNPPRLKFLSRGSMKYLLKNARVSLLLKSVKFE